MDLKVALLDRRFGRHGGSREPKDYFTMKYGVKWFNPDQQGQENTFAFIDAFGEVMTAPLEIGVDYTPLKDYDLLYLRLRDHNCATATEQLRRTCPKPVIIGYCDEAVNTRIGMSYWEYYKWIAKASRYTNVMTSSFPEKYERPKHEALGVKNWKFCPYAGNVFGWKQYVNYDKEQIVAGMWHLRGFKAGGYGDVQHTVTFRTLNYLINKYNVRGIFFLNFDGWKAEALIKPIQGRVELIKHCPSDEFNKLLAKCKIFMEEYQCPNYARSTVVSACVGTPAVGTDMNTPSVEIFPETTAIHNYWDMWTKKAELLLTNESFYKDMQQKGLERADYFYYPKFKERVMRLYNECLEKYRKV